MIRCGGQGDLLAGSLATFLHWALNVSTPSASPLLAGDHDDALVGDHDDLTDDVADYDDHCSHQTMMIIFSVVIKL